MRDCCRNWRHTARFARHPRSNLYRLHSDEQLNEPNFSDFFELPPTTQSQRWWARYTRATSSSLLLASKEPFKVMPKERARDFFKRLDEFGRENWRMTVTMFLGVINQRSVMQAVSFGVAGGEHGVCSTRRRPYLQEGRQRGSKDGTVVRRSDKPEDEAAAGPARQPIPGRCIPDWCGSPGAPRTLMQPAFRSQKEGASGCAVVNAAVEFVLPTSLAETQCDRTHHFVLLRAAA